MEIKKPMWWGYMHINGHIQVKRYFDIEDIREADSSPFCKETFDPFEAENRDEAIRIIQDKINGRDINSANDMTDGNGDMIGIREN